PVSLQVRECLCCSRICCNSSFSVGHRGTLVGGALKFASCATPARKVARVRSEAYDRRDDTGEGFAWSFLFGCSSTALFASRRMRNCPRDLPGRLVYSRMITFSSEEWTFSVPLYSISPSLRNLFMK